LLHFPIDLVVESKALEGSPEGSTVRLSGTDLDGFLVNGVWSIAERPSAQGECSTFLTVSQGKSTVLDAARSALLEDANRFQASQRVDSFHVLGHLVEGLLRSTTNDLNKLQNGRTFEAAHNAEYVAELGCSSIPQRVASLKGWTQGLLDTAVRNLPDAVIPPIRAATQALNTALDVYSAKHEAVRDWISDLREQNAQLSTWGTRGTAIFLGLLGVGSVTSFSTPAFLKPLADAGFIPEVPWDTLGALAFIAVGTGVAYTYWKQNWNNMMISGDHGDSLPRRIARAFYPQKDQAGK
jgi:hypothetical protein